MGLADVGRTGASRMGICGVQLLRSCGGVSDDINTRSYLRKVLATKWSYISINTPGERDWIEQGPPTGTS